MRPSNSLKKSRHKDSLERSGLSSVLCRHCETIWRRSRLRLPQEPIVSLQEPLPGGSSETLCPLTPTQQADGELICQRSETARKTDELTQPFMGMLRKLRGQDFETWLEAVEASQVPELRRFAQGLLRDKDAVVAG